MRSILGRYHQGDCLWPLSSITAAVLRQTMGPLSTSSHLTAVICRSLGKAYESCTSQYNTLPFTQAKPMVSCYNTIISSHGKKSSVRALCVQAYMQNSPYQQLEQGCSLRGLCAQMQATGKTGIQGQLLDRLSLNPTRGGIYFVHTHILYSH